MSSKEEAQSLSDKINSGSLPFSMKTTNYSTISPTLGGKALNAMALAAEIAMALICLFMIIWYRLPGVISCLTLTFQIALQILVISVPQYTITLPGIAGLILSAGMAVDANIVIFERVKEELVLGKSLRNALKAGFKRATPAILDGNVTTLIAAAVLFFLGSGTVKGFATTLMIGIVISMFTALFITRVIVNGLMYAGVQNPKYYGLRMK